MFPSHPLLQSSTRAAFTPQISIYAAQTMTPPSTSHKRALSSAEKPSPKKPASLEHPTYLTLVGEKGVLKSFTTDADALWRQIPIAKPVKHSAVYCLDQECEKHGKTTSKPATGESEVHNISGQDLRSIHEAAASEALPARTAKQSS